MRGMVADRKGAAMGYVLGVGVFLGYPHNFYDEIARFIGVLSDCFSLAQAPKAVPK